MRLGAAAGRGRRTLRQVLVGSAGRGLGDAAEGGSDEGSFLHLPGPEDQGSSKPTLQLRFARSMTQLIPALPATIPYLHILGE